MQQIERDFFDKDLSPNALNEIKRIRKMREMKLSALGEST